MMYAPFVKESDDQLAQVQVFFNLVASIQLRMTPPDATLGALVTATLFALPFFAIFTETSLVDELRRWGAGCLSLVTRRGTRVEPAARPST